MLSGLDEAFNWFFWINCCWSDGLTQQWLCFIEDEKQAYRQLLFGWKASNITVLALILTKNVKQATLDFERNLDSWMNFQTSGHEKLHIHCGQKKKWRWSF